MTVIQNERAKLSLDFDDAEEGAQMSRPEIDQRVQQISEESGFHSRAPLTAPIKSEVSSTDTPKRRTRFKTGRTYPFNTKIKPETYELICQLSDEATEREQRPVSMAEIIERALGALQKVQ
jgi:hypothetical protein